MYNADDGLKLSDRESFAGDVDKDKWLNSAIYVGQMSLNTATSKKFHKKQIKRLTLKEPTHINRFIESGRAAGAEALCL